MIISIDSNDTNYLLLSSKKKSSSTFWTITLQRFIQFQESKIAFFEKKFNFLGNRFTDWAEILYRKTTKKYAPNESNPKVLFNLKQELWFYEYLKISWVLFLSDFDLMVNNKFWSGQMWVASARHAAVGPQCIILWIYRGHGSHILRTRVYIEL